ncbi:baseplate J/gp47 family protein [Oculatella sp. LEGE 06141]|uniref:baseplate J/gp47 family protein n=1 Tax=Oculatella sp. LEGE 06141 TaxID=1828648 RepID=UPI001881E79A|nr:baseplate J/gp47 family protein [Oculatella sp. LEGE 06141]MBE9178661.1 baseplate J/gp47 family protein [Oculatella sp. LEGE 06141]
MDSQPLEYPVLDPRNERQLVEQSLVRTYNASERKLNDFSTSSVVRVFVEGMGFCAAEMLWHVNKLPAALLIAFLRNAGVERRLGTKATVNVTFTLAQPLSTPYTIPQGFQVADSSNRVTFTTNALLTIPPGGISGTVPATAEAIGTTSNLPAYTITRFTQPLTYLASVINLEAAAGGTDEESQESAIARGLNAIRRRNIVTADDYEQEAKAVLGEGSVVKAIGLLSGDKISYQLGAVHLFMLNQSGEAANSAQLSQVYEAIAPRTQIGTSLYVSSIDLVNVDADLVAKLGVGEDPTDVAQRLWEAYQDYLAPTKFSTGSSVIHKEVEYALRLAGGIGYIQALTLNEQTTNLPMPYPYSLPKAHSLYCTLIDDIGNQYAILKGAGEDYV